MNSMTHSTSDDFFLPLTTYRYQSKDLILLCYFLRLLAVIKLVQKNNRVKPIYFKTYSEIC